MAERVAPSSMPCALLGAGIPPHSAVHCVLAITGILVRKVKAGVPQAQPSDGQQDTLAPSDRGGFRVRRRKPWEEGSPPSSLLSSLCAVLWNSPTRRGRGPET